MNTVVLGSSLTTVVVGMVEGIGISVTSSVGEVTVVAVALVLSLSVTVVNVLKEASDVDESSLPVEGFDVETDSELVRSVVIIVAVASVVVIEGAALSIVAVASVVVVEGAAVSTVGRFSGTLIVVLGLSVVVSIIVEIMDVWGT